MTRQIFVAKVGFGKTHRPYVQGFIDLTSDELRSWDKIARDAGIDDVDSNRRRGLVNVDGREQADRYLAALKPGDLIEADEIVATMKRGDYENKPRIDVLIAVHGAWKRVKARPPEVEGFDDSDLAEADAALEAAQNAAPAAPADAVPAETTDVPF